MDNEYQQLTILRIMDLTAYSIVCRRRCFKCLAGIVLISFQLLGIGPVASSELPVVEFQVKSAYLYNLPKFVRWPESMHDYPREILTICVIEHEAMREYLYGLDGRSTPGYVLKVSYRNADTGLAGCHMAYIGRGSDFYTRSTLEWCQKNHILTIGDQPGFVELGGVVGFSLIDERVRLVINRSAARTSGFQISARLLELARVLD